MRDLRRLLAALSLAGLLTAAPAHAQFYFLEGDDRPVPPAGITPTASFRVPPTTFGRRGFFHWDLREFENCRVPYAITQAATGDISISSADARIAISTAFDTWEAVTPALIGFRREINSGTTLAAMDNENLMLWDGGVAANLAALGAPGSGTLAVTFIFYDGRCRIRESDVLYNDVDYQWKDGNNSLSLYTRSAAGATFALADGQTLTLKIDGGAAQTITFNTANFADITNATRAEIVAEINSQIAGGSAASLVGNVIGIRSSRVIYDGGTSIEVTGGTANGALGFPVALHLSKGVDVRSIALHENGHFLGIHHTSQANPEPNPVLFNAVMFWLAPPDGSVKHVLQPNDVQALNFLYTPEMGDAHDGAPNALSGSYQSHVHTTLPQGGAAGTLNGVTRYQTADGPVHLFGFKGPNLPAAPPLPAQNYSLDRFEWLGPDMDDHAVECEARFPNQDLLDDGVALAAKFTKGKPTRITVRVSHTNAAGRYAAVDSARLNFNGYIDFNLDSKFTSPADLHLWWAGVPAATVAAGTLTSKNFVPSESDLSSNPMKLVFDVPVPAGAPDNTWARFRLDFGEDEGRSSHLPPGGWEGNLAPATGEAQFGEVEDYPIEATPQRIISYCVADTIVGPDSKAIRRFRFGNAGSIIEEVCWALGDDQGWITGSNLPLSGQQLLQPDEDLFLEASVTPPVDCYDGQVDSLKFLVWPCDDPAAVDTCYALVQCAQATPTLLAHFEGRSGIDFVELTYWLAEDGDLSGVHVLRASGSGEEFRRLTTQPIAVDGRSRYQFTDREVETGTDYRYRLVLVGRDGSERVAGNLRVRTPRAEFALGRPTPNPASQGFSVDLALARSGEALLKLIDVSGRAVRTVFRGSLSAGEHRMRWDGLRDDGSPAPHGLYFLVYESGGRRLTRTVVVAR